MLTPIERELLRCVEELMRTCEQSVESLEASKQSLRLSEQRVSDLSTIFARDLIPCVLESAKLQTDLLKYWAISANDTHQLRRLHEAMSHQSKELNRQVQALETAASRIGDRR